MLVEKGASSDALTELINRVNSYTDGLSAAVPDPDGPAADQALSLARDLLQNWTMVLDDGTPRTRDNLTSHKYVEAARTFVKPGIAAFSPQSYDSLPALMPITKGMVVSEETWRPSLIIPVVPKSHERITRTARENRPVLTLYKALWMAILVGLIFLAIWVLRVDTFVGTPAELILIFLGAFAIDLSTYKVPEFFGSVLRI